MTLTASEEIRIQAVERKLNDIQVALNRLSTRKEMKALSGIRQADIIKLQEDLEHLAETGISPGLTAHKTDSSAHTELNTRYYLQSVVDTLLTGKADIGTLRETSGPTTLTVGNIADGELLQRSGSTLIGAASSSDHGGLAGLTDDDHTQYLLVDGTRAMTGSLTIAGNISVRAGGGVAGSEQYGEGATATGIQSTAVGNTAKATDTGTIGIGFDANATNNNAISIGYQSDATGNGSMAFGKTAQATGTVAIAIGQISQATDTNAIAIGQNARAFEGPSLAIGSSAHVPLGGNGGIAIGDGASVSTGSGVALGQSTSVVTQGVAIGTSASAQGTDSIGIGRGVSVATDATGSVVIGALANTVGADTNNVAIGPGASVASNSNVVVGLNARAGVEGGVVAIGESAQGGDTRGGGVAVGHGAAAHAFESIAIGGNAVAGFDRSLAIGHEAEATFIGDGVLGSSIEPIHFRTYGNVTSGERLIAGKQFAQSQFVTSTPPLSTQQIDWDDGNYQVLSLASAPSNITISQFLNGVAGSIYTLEIVQAAGSPFRNVVWPSSVSWPGGTTPTITATANRRDIVELRYNGTTYLARIDQDYA